MCSLLKDAKTGLLLHYMVFTARLAIWYYVLYTTVITRSGKYILISQHNLEK